MFGRLRQGRRARAALIALAGLTLALASVGIGLYQLLAGSLPQFDGRVTVKGLSAPVTVERDALGIPTLRGANRTDLARALGFIHAQDRFFQMDLLRRTAAGELAELFGKAALAADLDLRAHRFRARARDVLERLPSNDRNLVDAYGAGVNAGLAALGSRPFEYLLLRQAPAPWLPEDMVLVVFAMYLDLQHEQWPRESVRGVMHEVLPPALVEFLDPEGTEWDAPLVGGPGVTPPPPGPEVVDLRLRPPTDGYLGFQASVSEGIAGSNNWAVAGSHTVHGGALLANDMHLSLRAPNIWYRASLAFPDDAGRERRITGVTLPGTPAVVAGGNGRIAWGFTNSEGDWADLIVLETTADGAYLTPDGPRRFEQRTEIIRVKGGEERSLPVRSTIWGPVIDVDHRGRQRVLHWAAYDPRAVNLALLRLETADSVQEAVEIANRAGAPAQNFVVADADGHIGWTISGSIPNRAGRDGQIPRLWSEGGWNGWLEPAEYPRIIDPPSGRIWTANARVVEGQALNKLGDGGYALGARARQIRDRLFAIERADEAAMLAVQLDDRAVFLQRWRDLLLEVLDEASVAADPRRRELRRQVENWGGRAAVDSVGYRLVRGFRDAVAQRALGPLVLACRQADPRFDYGWLRRYEGPLWRLVRERPLHLLDARYSNWRALFLGAVDGMLAEVLRDGNEIEKRTWGERNTSQIQHPFSRVVPLLSVWLDMPPIPLPGDIYMPRVQGPVQGASERMVISPGREAEAIMHMPGGQSGHPLSPHYRDGHQAWVVGEPTPFLPGPPQHSLILTPLHE